MTSRKISDNSNIVLNDTILERIKVTKFLGVLIDEGLTWKNHIDCISKTISRNIGIMNKLKHCLYSTLYITNTLLYFNFTLY